MPADSEYLRQHYASLSDAGLMAIDRADLVEVAARCYDDEVRRRDLDRRRLTSTATNPAPERSPTRAMPRREDDKPDWLEEATDAYSQVDTPNSAPEALTNARDALERAGIPCYLDLSEIPEEKSEVPKPTHLWRLLVPGNLNLRAASVLERDIFNGEFEAAWKSHLEAFSDEELRWMNPQVAFCGLFDRVERVTRAYNQEISRRGLKSTG